MREIEADLWVLTGDARCITTNGSIKTGDKGVMGRGVARQAAVLYPGAEAALGRYLTANGNHTGVIFEADDVVTIPLVALPTKHFWFEKADAQLIKRSLAELIALTDARNWHTVLLPRPGCGKSTGGLLWEFMRPLCAKRLDDRFLVVERPVREP